MRKLTTLITILGSLAFILFTRDMYVTLYEWLGILLACTVLGHMIVRGVAKSYNIIILAIVSIGFSSALYFTLTFLDVIGDYWVGELFRGGPVDGAIPPLSEVIPEAFDDYGYLNLSVPVVLGLVSLLIAKISYKRVKS